VPNDPHPFLAGDGPIAFAHRGGASDVPENTMPAFEHAVNLGYRYVETDVHVTADGVLVAFHDVDLARTTGRPGSIGTMRWRELRTLLVDGVAPIPTLDELLATWPELRVNIDCKTDAAEDALVETLHRTSALDRVCVGAFSERRIRRLRARLGPGLCSALGPVGVSALRFARPRSLAGHTAQVPVRWGRIEVVDERFVANAHRLGIDVHVWTIDDPAEIDRLLDLGVDGIMTDRPAVLREVFERRGLWDAHG
jgi:glycerophosphoryl diester phosphodiesterase